MYRGGQRGSGANSPAQNQRIAQQQAILAKLKAGQGISVDPASPFLAGIRGLLGKGPIGTVYGAELDGRSVLKMPGGMEQTGFLGPINVGGRTYFPAKSGKDLIFMQGGTPASQAKGLFAADIGGDGRGDEARALASQYAPKPFPMTPAGQFERYFKTPEMDQYFGAASRGTAAPKDVEAMQALAGKTVAPGKTPEELSAFYRAESAMGRAQMPQIQQALQDKYGKETKLSAWAAANPMLAQRLYVKMQGGRPLAPDQETVMGDLGSRAQDPRGYTPKAFGMPDNPASPIEQPVGDQENRSTQEKVQNLLDAIKHYGI